MISHRSAPFSRLSPESRLLLATASLAALMLGDTGMALGQSTRPATDNANGDIVVTAQKRSESVNKVAASIAVISAGDIAARGITSATGLQDQISNVNIAKGTQGTVDLTIRGISSSDNTNKGDPAVALNVDGVYVGRPQAAGATFFDLERVEVLRGPQGTLYGRNANAGAINVISHKPSGKYEASLDATLGNYNTRETNAMVNVPITSTLAARGVLSYQYHDGYSHTADAVNGFGRNQDDQNSLSGRMIAQWKPTDKFTLLAGVDASHNRGAGSGMFAVQNDQIPYNRTKTAEVQGSRHDNAVNEFIQANYDFSFASVTYLAGHRFLGIDQIQDLGAGMPGLWGIAQSKTYQDSHELRLTSAASSKLKWVAGYYWFREEGKGGTFDIRLPHAAGAGRIIDYVQGPTISKSNAFFGQASYPVLDHTRLIGGLRSTRDAKSRIGVTYVGSDPTALPTENAAGKWSKVTWKAGIEQDIGTMMAYVSASTGYKAGGFNDGCLVGTGTYCTASAKTLYYNPESITAYELGLKGRAFDNLVTFSADGFYYDYNNLQKSTASNNTIVTVNAAKATVKGLEGDARIRTEEHGHLSLSAGYLDAKYGSYTAPNGQDLSGRDLDKAPHFNATINYTHDWILAHDLKLTGYAGTKYTTAYTLSDPGTASLAAHFFRQAPTTRSELSLTLADSDGRWSLQGFGRNLENKSTIGGLVQNASVYYLAFNDPRTYGMRLAVKY